MLSSTFEADLLNQAIELGKTRLVVPTSVRPLLEAQGICTPVTGDLRRFPRYHSKGWLMLRYRPTFPTKPRPAEDHAAILLDVSRGGIGMLHSEEVFPSELLKVVMPNGIARYVQVARCRCLGPQCYLVGGRFVGK